MTIGQHARSGLKGIQRLWAHPPQEPNAPLSHPLSEGGTLRT